MANRDPELEAILSELHEFVDQGQIVRELTNLVNNINKSSGANLELTKKINQAGIDKLAKLMENLLKYIGVYTKETGTVIKGVKEALLEKDRAGVGSTNQQALMSFAKSYELLAKQYEVASKGQREPLAAFGSATFKSNVTGQNLQKSLLTKDDMEDSLDRVSDKIISFFSGENDPNSPKEKKKTFNLGLEIANAIINSPIVQGVSKDILKLTALWTSAKLTQHFGKFGTFMGGILGILLTSLPKIIDLFAQYMIIKAATGGFSGWGKGAKATSSSVGLIRGLGSIEPEAKVASTAPGLIRGFGSLPIAAQAAQNTVAKESMIARLMGGIVSPLKKAFEPLIKSGQALARAVPLLGTFGKILQGFGRVMPFLSVLFGASDMIKGIGAFGRGDKSEGSQKTIGGAMQMIAPFLAFIPMVGPALAVIVELLGVVVSNWKWIKNFLRELYTKITSPLADIWNLIKMHLPSPGGSDSTSDVGGSGSGGFWGNVHEKISGWQRTPHNPTGTASSHVSPRGTKIDLTARGIPADQQQSLILKTAQQLGYKVAVTDEGSHKDVFFDLPGATPKGSGIAKGSITAQTLALADRTKAVLSPEGYITNFAMMTQRQATSELGRLYASDPRVARNYDIIPGKYTEGAFTTDVYDKSKDITYGFKGLRAFMDQLNKNAAEAGYKSGFKLSSTIGTQGVISDEAIAKASLKKDISVSTLKKEESKKTEETTKKEEVTQAPVPTTTTVKNKNNSGVNISMVTGNDVFSKVLSNASSIAIIGVDTMRGYA